MKIIKNTAAFMAASVLVVTAHAGTSQLNNFDGPTTAMGTPTARNLSDRAADVFNVRDYGAVGIWVAGNGL